ncbi:ribosome assembly RNA-binding protein YhbY [Oceanispirochaeta crateris]|jgi:RNA-binding protein|uniref:Ribosome assembly RNA-binding protein YhbY n=1 Tax=Oceanispirochaeta crateris TaxID=2518645 RepID=A0A5C1QI89_9SPIO|nr:ribosome assembly RNA-binding protein YhbY [Oceanispirochaeta crateris]QEN07853.1 ribosome assembly RNA-binding protein YhbY [Oceanispirochaeta crateris]
MEPLKGFQRSYLGKKAHSLKPVVMIGGKGLTEAVIKAVDAELENHEMIKIKFVDNKETRRELAEELVQKTESQLVRVIGNIAIVYRYQKEHDKRIYHVPKD